MMARISTKYALLASLILAPSSLLAQDKETHRSRELGRLLSEARAEVELIQLQLEVRRLKAELERAKPNGSEDSSEPNPTTINKAPSLSSDVKAETKASENKPVESKTLETIQPSYKNTEARASEKKFNSYSETTTMLTELSHSDGWSVVNAPIGVRLGFYITRNISLEGMLGTSIFPTQAYGGNYGFSYLYSVGMKSSINLNDKTSLFGRLGIGGGEVIVDGGKYPFPYEETDIQFGFGIQRDTKIFSRSNAYFAFDYNLLYNKYSYRIGSLGLAFGKYF